MTRISSLLLSTSLLVLPISAFAQQATVPVTTPMPATTVAPADLKGKTAAVKTETPVAHALTGQAAAPAGAKGKTAPAKTELHSAKGAVTIHAKAGTVAPAKTAEPHKS
jgi:hypothetical protein